MKSALTILALTFFLLDCCLALPSATAAGMHKDTIESADTLSRIEDTVSVKGDSLNNHSDSTAVTKDTLDIIIGTESSNTIPGFRVQIGSTLDLSEAIGDRTRAETLLADYNVYIIYDSPYYKIRAGDFRARYDASQAANYITGHGFPGAWVVPDNVFKNPQTRSRQ
ncbi:MAG TPA: SPOR domain-containing protein [Candidatus Acidoferrales bacterium]|nr:SPOR domain-containing protein [Candidatus Acidoferrales bacterium]